MISTRQTTASSPWEMGAVFVVGMLAALTLALSLSAGVAMATTFTVINTGDSGTGSLRQAITDTNSNTNPTEVDAIEFDIPTSDSGCDATSEVCTISPTSALPDVTQAVSIDGYTQGGASANTLTTGSDAALKIELNGEFAGSGADGLKITGTNSVVRGLIINRWSDEGVEVDGAGASGNTIVGNFIGTDIDGVAGLVNFGSGVGITDAPNNVVGGTSAASRNVISSNNGDGVLVDGASATGNTIRGNYIGTDASGTQDLGNGEDGVQINDARNNVIGGTSTASRNIISSNNGKGVVVIGTSASGNRIEGNYIGTDASGTQDLGNSEFGLLFIQAPNNVVGGTSASARNIVSGNEGTGVLVVGDNASGNRIEGNYVGTDASGTRDLGNFNGVEIGGPNNVVGGKTDGARNVISGSTFNGVLISGGSASGNRIEGNYIGTDASGEGDIGNSARGVWINDAPKNVVGGTSASARNTISGNEGAGVFVSGGNATGNTILRNSIFDNGGLGIDLEGGTENASGVTENDAQDLDTGPNNLQNYPTITSATTSGGQTTIQGTLNSIPNDAFNIQFFSGPAAAPSGFGEGKTYVGQTNVLTNSNGNATFSITTSAPISGGQVVATTATNSVTKETSEFSEAVEVEDNTPLAQCSDGADNDSDGKVDFGGANADPGCESAADDSESPDPPPPDVVAPTVISTNPPAGSTGVGPGINVSATFSEAMDASTINPNTFKLFENVGTTRTRVSAVVSYSASARKAILNPNANLAAGARYTARVTTGARDLSGNALAKTKTFSFTVKQ